MTDFERLEYDDAFKTMISRLEIARMTLKRHKRNELLKKYIGCELYWHLRNLDHKFERDLDSEIGCIRRYTHDRL